MEFKAAGRLRRHWTWREKLLTLYYSFQHPGTPVLAKLPALLAFGYLLSPVDLIPDFIPLAGWLDDALIVPFLVRLSLKLLPAQVRGACEERASWQTRRAAGILNGVFAFGVALFA